MAFINRRQYPALSTLSNLYKSSACIICLVFASFYRELLNINVAAVAWVHRYSPSALIFRWQASSCENKMGKLCNKVWTFVMPSWVWYLLHYALFVLELSIYIGLYRLIFGVGLRTVPPHMYQAPARLHSGKWNMKTWKNEKIHKLSCTESLLHFPRFSQSFVILITCLVWVCGLSAPHLSHRLAHFQS